MLIGESVGAMQATGILRLQSVYINHAKPFSYIIGNAALFIRLKQQAQHMEIEILRQSAVYGDPAVMANRIRFARRIHRCGITADQQTDGLPQVLRLWGSCIRSEYRYDNQ